jgi:hypothetical protein
MKPSGDTMLMETFHQLVPTLLKEHAYGVYELAQTCAQQLHEPLCEIMTPFCDSLYDMVNNGELCYDRQRNQVQLT